MAAFRITYSPSRSGFAAMLVGPEVRAACRAAADRGKVIAVGLSEGFADSHHYAQSFEVADGGVVRLFGHDRARVYLVNKAAYAAAVEWGRRRQAGHHVLSRTLDALGAT